jgi:hypothetical protein
MAAVKDWSAMTATMADLLERRTGAGVAVWNERVRVSGADGDEPQLRCWLPEQGVTGYAQQLLVMERFGYPDFFSAMAGELIDAQYADRPQLRPILDCLLAVAGGIGEVTVQARKGYVSLVGPKRTFAMVRASTKQRVDLGLRLPGRTPGGRLEAAKGLGNESINVRVGLQSAAEVDGEVSELLGQAHAANL